MGGQDLAVATELDVRSDDIVGGTRTAAPKAGRYVSVAAKFWISFAFAVVWVTASVWLSLPWLHDLSDYITIGGAIIAVALVAYIPARLMSFMAMSLLLD